MPVRGARICGCGKVVQGGHLCACQRKRDYERKARFDAKRPSARARGYSTRWDKYRVAYLAKHPSCARCGAPATIVHHKLPHRGDMRLFWDTSNHTPACEPCHSGPLQSQEGRASR